MNERSTSEPPVHVVLMEDGDGIEPSTFRFSVLFAIIYGTRTLSLKRQYAKLISR